MHISIETSDNPNDVRCTAVIVVPEEALVSPGLIRALTLDKSSGRKHDLYALAQTALLQFEEGVLGPIAVDGKIRVAIDGETLELDSGLLIARLLSGQIAVLINSDQQARRFLVTALRFCTRWIRLDL